MMFVSYIVIGTYLASGGDCGELVLWKQADVADCDTSEVSWVRAGLLRCRLDLFV